MSGGVLIFSRKKRLTETRFTCKHINRSQNRSKYLSTKLSQVLGGIIHTLFVSRFQNGSQRLDVDLLHVSQITTKYKHKGKMMKTFPYNQVKEAFPYNCI